MPSFCSVVDCSNRGMRDNVSFFKFPRNLNFKHKTHLNKLSSIRRKKWIEALKRNDLTESKLKYAQVCSDHFITGKPAELTDDMNPDWVPSVNMGYRLQLKSFGSKSSNKRIALKTEVTEELKTVYYTKKKASEQLLEDSFESLKKYDRVSGNVAHIF